MKAAYDLDVSISSAGRASMVGRRANLKIAQIYPGEPLLREPWRGEQIRERPLLEEPCPLRRPGRGRRAGAVYQAAMLDPHTAAELSLDEGRALPRRSKA